MITGCKEVLPNVPAFAPLVGNKLVESVPTNDEVANCPEIDVATSEPLTVTVPARVGLFANTTLPLPVVDEVPVPPLPVGNTPAVIAFASKEGVVLFIFVIRPYASTVIIGISLALPNVPVLVPVVDKDPPPLDDIVIVFTLEILPLEFTTITGICVPDPNVPAVSFGGIVITVFVKVVTLDEIVGKS